MAPNDPNSDDAEPMGRGLALVLIVIGAALSIHFALRLEESLKQGANPLGVGYVAVFVLVGVVLMVMGLRRFSEQDEDEEEDRH